MASLFGIRLLTRTFLVTRSLLLARQSQSILQRGRIPPQTTEEELRAKFPGCLMANIIKDKSTGLSKGFGFVHYPSYEEAKEALNLTVEIGGRILTLGQAKNALKANSAATSSTLHVGGVCFAMTEAELLSLFPGSISATLIFDHVTGLKAGYGFVKFSNPEDAEEGLKLNGLVYKGRTIKVDVAKDLQPTDDGNLKTRKKNIEPSSILYVGNLSYTTIKSDLMKAFDGCIRSRIVFDETGKSKGFGFVEYSSVDEAKAVFDKQEEMVLDGRVLHINYSSRKIKQGGVRSSDPTAILYVGNLSYTTTKSDLMKAFVGCAEAQITFNPLTGKSMGFGYVKYHSVDEAKEVYDKDIVLDGRTLFIDYDHGNLKIRKPNTEPSAELFVSHLSDTTTVSDLMKAFDGCVKAVIKFDARTGKSRRFGFVDYASVEEAKAVFDKQEEIVVNGHTLYIDYSLKVQQDTSSSEDTSDGDSSSDSDSENTI
ncbi:nucleolin-like isoform X2 [Dysidea avara]|uniref:nucleolin-like isoform X2 n=1 Tax=Dysidea avara TaxID=196820 RepID=UPI003326AFBA